MYTNRVEHAGRIYTVARFQTPQTVWPPLPYRTETARQDYNVAANLTWELRTLERSDGSTEQKWVLDIEATVDGMRAHLWGDVALDGADYVAVRTLHSKTLYLVPKAKWVEPLRPA